MAWGGAFSRKYENGVMLAAHFDAAVTNGRSFTVGVNLECALAAATLNGRELYDLKCVVTGADTPAGMSSAGLLAERGAENLILTGKDPLNRSRLDRLAGTILFESGISVVISNNLQKALAGADLVLVCGGLPLDKIRFFDMMDKAVVCDVTEEFGRGAAEERCSVAEKKISTRHNHNQGYNLTGRLRINNSPFSAGSEGQKNSLYPELTIIRGGVVQVPADIKLNLSPRFSFRHCSPALAETLLLALAGRLQNYSLGPGLRPEKITEIMQLAKKNGLSPVGYYNSQGRFVPLDIKFGY